MEPQSTPYLDTEHHAVFDIAALGDQRATGKRRAQLQRKGVAGSTQSSHLLFISPEPKDSPGGASKEDTALRTSTPPNRGFGLSSGSRVGGGEKGPQPRLQGGRTTPNGVAVTGSDKLAEGFPWSQAPTLKRTEWRSPNLRTRKEIQVAVAARSRRASQEDETDGQSHPQ